jgi:hypothetical protein
MLQTKHYLPQRAKSSCICRLLISRQCSMSAIRSPIRAGKADSPGIDTDRTGRAVSTDVRDTVLVGLLRVGQPGVLTRSYFEDRIVVERPRHDRRIDGPAGDSVKYDPPDCRICRLVYFDIEMTYCLFGHCINIAYRVHDNVILQVPERTDTSIVVPTSGPLVRGVA